MTPDTLPDTSDEIGLLDLLIPIVENLRLLILATIFAAALSYALSFLQTASYESVAIQSGDAQLEALYNSTQGHSALVERSGYKKADETVEAAQERLSENLNASFNSKNNTVTIKAVADSPAMAQRIVQEAIEVVSKLNQRRLNDLRRLQEQFAIATQREREYSAAAEAVAKKVAESAETSSFANLIQSQNQLLNSARDAQITSANLADRLSQIQSFDLIQQPTLPHKQFGPKRGVITIISALGVAFLLLIIIFARAAFRLASQNPKSSDKLEKLRLAWHRIF